nr:hypothetical protein Iba_chr08cCG4320 [Ipomoea batatas]GMD27662.1 hypothetical protein Iba_chr08eCG0010 [Ipomoea batatas]GMD53084.1 hypothetical protein Iba_scaffold174998CG0010 [Ipomoea batatas]GME17353.1 hypothetical protein Iba_scaffold18627CG0010 [Ipomoea batatas]
MNCPRLSPVREEMLMTDPPSLALRMSKHTYFVTNHVPVRFVLMLSFHSFSVRSNGVCLLPANLGYILESTLNNNYGVVATSNTGIVNQGVDTSERGPSLLNGGLDGGTACADIEHNSHRSGLRNGVGIAGTTDSIDLVAERFEAVHSACGGDDSAAGFGQVEAEFSAQPR